MKKYFLIIFLLSIYTTVLTNAQVAKYVVIIGVDGMSPDGLLNAQTTNIDYLIANGAVSLKARGVMPTVSSPNWASMIMGAGPEQHGITSNGWDKNNFSIEPTAKGVDDMFPTMFSVLHQSKPDLIKGAIYHWDGFGRLFEKNAVDFDITSPNEVTTIDETVKTILEKKPNLTFIQLDHVDGAGHEFGHGTQKYYESIELADMLIGRVIAALNDAKMYDETIIIISADHGGIGYGHGGDSMEEVQIPVIISGKGILKNKKILSPVNIYDIASTVLYIFDIDQPYEWIGRPIFAAFENYDKKFIKQHTSHFVFPPKINIKSGKYTDQIPKISLTPNNAETKIYFTTDGSKPEITSNLYNNQLLELTKSTTLRAVGFSNETYSDEVKADYILISKENGVNYKYYEGEFESLPDFSNLIPKKEGVIYNIDLKEIADKRDDNYAVIFDGFIYIEEDNGYEFFITSDDGSKLFINDELLIDNDGTHGAQERKGNIELKKGKHKLTVQYFEKGGDEALKVQLASPQIKKRFLIASDLFLR